MNVFELSAALILNKEAYDKGLADAEGSANKSGGAMSKVLGAAGTAIKTGFAAAGAAAIAFGTSAVKTGSEFDVAMSQVAATMGVTKSDIGDLREYAEEMGAKTAFSAAEAADGMNILAMAGLSASEIMEQGSSGASALETTLNLASAGAMSMADAASYVTGAVKGFGDEASNASYYADLMAKGATLANTDVSALGEALGDISATASSYGQSADSATVALLRLADANVTGSAASTAMAAAMKNLYTPTDQAKAAMDALGVAAYENGKALDFNDVVNSLTAALSDLDDEQRNTYLNTIFGIQGLDAYNKMAAVSSNKQKTFWDGLANASGSAAQQAATQLDNLKGDVTLFQSALDGLRIKVFDFQDGPLRSIVQFATQGITDITLGLEEGGLTGAFQAFVNVFDEGMSQLGNGLMTFTQNILTNLPNTLTQAGQIGMQMFTNIYDSLMTALPQFANAGAEALRQIAGGLAQSVPELLAKVMPMLVDLSASIRENASTLIDAGLELILQLAQGLMNSLPTLLATVPDIVINIAGVINDNAPKIFAAAVQLIWTIIKGLFDALPALVENFGKIIEAVLAVWDAINWVNLGTKVINFIANGMKSLATKVPELLKSIGNSAHDKLKNINWLELGKNVITFIKNGLHALLNDIPNKLKSIGDSAVRAFKNIDWIDLGKNIINGIVQGIENMAGTLFHKMEDLASSALNKAKEVLGIESPSKVFRDQVGKFIPAGIAVGIDRNAGTVYDSLDDMLDGATKHSASFRINPVDAVVSGASGMTGTQQPYVIYLNTTTELDGKVVARSMNEILGAMA